MPASQRKAVYGLIRGLVGQANIIAIPRLFVKLSGGGYEQAAFLAQCIFWSDYSARERLTPTRPWPVPGSKIGRKG